MKQLYTWLISFLLCLNISTSTSQVLISSEFISTTPAALISLVSNGFPTNYDVNFYKLTYNTTDAQGNPTTATGAVAIPESSCDIMPMLAYCHGTVLRKQDIPSAENTESYIGKTFSSIGYITVMPDYVGLGDSPGLHPYVHATSQATATIDLIRATREFMSNDLTIQDNNQLFITGYSQGGHAAMATHKYIQDNNLYNEFNVVASAPCSGPYDLSGSQSGVITSGLPYSNPGYVVYLLMSYQTAYGNLYTTLSDVLKSPYDVDMLTYFDGVQNQYDMSDVNAALPNQLNGFMEDSVLTNFANNPNHPLRKALEDNDNYDWAPQRPVRMMYCTGDEQVDYTNSTTAAAAMNANNAPDVAAVEAGGNSVDHGGCVIPALSEAYEFFETKTTFCGFAQSTNELASRFEFSYFPNPATSEITMAFPVSVGTVHLLSLQGQLMKEVNVTSTQLILSVDELPKGMYFLRWNQQNGQFIERVVIQ